MITLTLTYIGHYLYTYYQVRTAMVQVEKWDGFETAVCRRWHSWAISLRFRCVFDTLEWYTGGT